MFVFDMPLDQLRTFSLPLTREHDFDAFWERHLARSKDQPLHASEEAHPYPVDKIVAKKVSYDAYDGGRIVGWLISPADDAPHPTLTFFHGYGGEKGKIPSFLMWALMGFTCVAWDVRGQLGESTDAAVYPGGRSSGWLTGGLMDPDQYFYTRAYMDTVRALDFAVTRPEVDPERMGVLGCSQGGGLSMAAAALDTRVKLCIAEVPGFCHFGRTLAVTKAAPWTDLIAYFAHWPQRMQPAMRTLSYVELNNHAERITCPTLISVGLQDEICVPSSIYAAYNRLGAREKCIEPFPYNGHQALLNIDTMIAWSQRYLLNT
jgi:cephalosporin-C deacetylase